MVLAYAQRPPLSEDVFKNVQVMKGIPVDEFKNKMGVFSAALDAPFSWSDITPV